MTVRTAQCACGRVEITVEGEPLQVATCHCDFCQKRTGSVLSAAAWFATEQVVAISGETTTYNGLEIDGVAAMGGVGIDYNFCATCGSTVYWTFSFDGQSITAIAVGNFVDPDFPMPTVEYFTSRRHHWVPPVPDAAQDPVPDA
jgi:hypothetical protein